MRCLALSQSFLAGGWSVGFACSRETFKSVKAFDVANVQRLTLEVEREGEPKAIAKRWPSIDILVIDHYQRDAQLERACRAFAKRIVVIDDLMNRSHNCDVLVDSAASSEAAYRDHVPANCRILVGPAFAPLAPEFHLMRPAALARRDGRPVERVLVSFGQIDAGNTSELALRALADAGFRGEVDIVMGSTAPHLATISKLINELHGIRLHVDASNMSLLMTMTDLALGAGGTTSWERCCLGLPSLMVEIADNQHGVIDLIEKRGAGVSLGPVEKLNVKRTSELLRELIGNKTSLTHMSLAGAALVDGRGADRVLLAAIGTVATKTGNEAKARLAETSDEAWLLELQQKPETRKFSNFSQPPSVEEHKVWFQRTLSDPVRLLTIIEVNNKPVSMLRLDSGKHAVRVNIAVDPAQHRQGLGAAALALASRIVPGRPLEAEVKSGNKASLALFETAGYRKIGNDLYRREPL